MGLQLYGPENRSASKSSLLLSPLHAGMKSRFYSNVEDGVQLGVEELALEHYASSVCECACVCLCMYVCLCVLCVCACVCLRM